MSDEEKKPLCCTACKSSEQVYKGTLMTEGKGKQVEFQCCGICGYSERSNFTDGPNSKIHIYYVSQCVQCDTNSEPFHIDGAHPSVNKIRENFYSGKESFDYCKSCNKTGGHIIVSLHTETED